METEVLGSIPGVDRKLFFRSWQIISNWVSLTGTLDVGLFCLLLSLSFRVQFASITHIRFLPSPSSLRLMQSRAMLANVLCSLFSITLSLRTKPALLVSSGGRKKPNQTSTCYLNFDKMLSRPENNGHRPQALKWRSYQCLWYTTKTIKWIFISVESGL